MNQRRRGDVVTFTRPNDRKETSGLIVRGPFGLHRCYVVKDPKGRQFSVPEVLLGPPKPS